MYADVIIVLGVKIMPSGLPTQQLTNRVITSVNLYNSGCAKYIIMTGGIGQSVISEAKIMKTIAVEYGVPKNNIITDELSLNTFENVVNSIYLMDKYKWQHAILVSDSFHLTRSTLLFRAFGKSITAIAQDKGRGNTKKWIWYYYHLREIPATLWYFIKFLFHNVKRY